MADIAARRAIIEGATWEDRLDHSQSFTSGSRPSISIHGSPCLNQQLQESRNRTYSATNIDPAFAKQRQTTCPLIGRNTTLSPLDTTPAFFETAYFKNLVKQRGLLISDQALFNGGSTDDLVKIYSTNPKAFWNDFAESTIKMGNIKPLTGNQGQIRTNCGKVNY
ncbi:hypothetical protein DITRI_Ditri17bG0007300 [Diplodiscus trichospermus]